MSQLQFPFLEIDDGSGVQKRGNLLTCSCTQGDEADLFYIFQPEGLDHLHVQCDRCERSYCMSKVCFIPYAVEIPP